MFHVPPSCRSVSYVTFSLGKLTIKTHKYQNTALCNSISWCSAAFHRITQSSSADGVCYIFNLKFFWALERLLIHVDLRVEIENVFMTLETEVDTTIQSQRPSVAFLEL